MQEGLPNVALMIILLLIIQVKSMIKEYPLQKDNYLKIMILNTNEITPSYPQLTPTFLDPFIWIA
jgi:hypothetical protein